MEKQFSEKSFPFRLAFITCDIESCEHPIHIGNTLLYYIIVYAITF